MDSIKPANSANLSGKLRSFSKALRFRTGEVAPDDNIRKAKVQATLKDHFSGHLKDDDEYQQKMSEDAILAKVFATIASVKAAYAQLQIAQFEDDDLKGVQSSDVVMISELKRISELKQSYLKKQIDPSPHETLLLAEIQENEALLKTYVIRMNAIESQLKHKESKISSLKEKAEECNKEIRKLEKRLSQNEVFSVFNELHISGLNPNHFNTVLKHTIKAIRSFVKLLINGMESSGWDIDAAATSIDSNVVYTQTKHKCFAFESFVCREMFDGFQSPNFALHKESLPEGKQFQQHFFDQFMKLKSVKAKPLILGNSSSTLFWKFCRAKYLQLIHPKMELSLFGNLSQRNLVNSGRLPETPFFDTFSEMARRIWLLNCLAFSFEPEASIFQVRKGSRFSEIYMESVTEDMFFSSEHPQVSLAVVPGFKIGKTIIQAQVYLSPS